MVRYGIFRRPGRDGDDIRFNRVHPAMAFLLRPAYPEALLALPVQPPSRLGVRVPAVGLAATRAAAFVEFFGVPTAGFLIISVPFRGVVARSFDFFGAFAWVFSSIPGG